MLDSLTTLPDPGITPQDGFESDVPALSGPTLVETDPISGTRSLFVDGPTVTTVNGIDGPRDEVRNFEVPLDEPGADVIVSFEMEEEDNECGLAHCASAPALIDDLRIE
jgi:hypothetical protein